MRHNPGEEIDLAISIKKVFTFPVKSCIVIREQSRRQRVKCHRDGEFARRTKEIFHDAVTAPAVAYRKNSLYVATILGRANGRLYIAAPVPDPESVNSRRSFVGIFVFRICEAAYGCTVAYIIRRHFYVKSQKHSHLQKPLFCQLLA